MKSAIGQRTTLSSLIANRPIRPHPLFEGPKPAMIAKHDLARLLSRAAVALANPELESTTDRRWLIEELLSAGQTISKAA